MRITVITILILCVCTPSIIFGQNKNRISLQSGLFHAFFDGTPIVNSEPINQSKRIQTRAILSNVFHGVLNDSRGISYQRVLNKKSALSIEYMFFNAGYLNHLPLNYNGKPILYVRQLKTVNVTYSRKLNLSSKLDFTFGIGGNYRWGLESILIANNWAGWGYEATFNGYYRHDFGANGRVGIEYNPKTWLTFYSNINFLGTIYLGAKDVDGNNAHSYYKQKYAINNMPCRYDLSWQFGVGFNFGR